MNIPPVVTTKDEFAQLPSSLALGRRRYAVSSTTARRVSLLPTAISLSCVRAALFHADQPLLRTNLLMSSSASSARPPNSGSESSSVRIGRTLSVSSRRGCARGDRDRYRDRAYTDVVVVQQFQAGVLNPSPVLVAVG